MTISADGKAHETEPTSKMCLSIVLTCCWLQKRHDLDTDGMNDVPCVKSSVMLVETMLLTLEFVVNAFVSFYQCIFQNALLSLL